MEIIAARSGEARLLPGQTKEDAHTLEWARELVQHSRDDHEREFSRGAFDAYLQYRNIVDSGINPDDYHSNIGAGIAFPTTETLVARLCAPWQAGDRMFDAVALDEAGVERAPSIEAWINDGFQNRIPRMFSKCELVMKSGLVLSRGVMRHGIRIVPEMTRLERSAIRLLSPFLPAPVKTGSILQWAVVPPSKRFNFDYVDPFDFWWVGSGRFFPENCEQTIEQSYYTTHGCWLEIEAGGWPKSLRVDDGDAVGYDQYTAMRLGNEPRTLLVDRLVRMEGRAPKRHRLERVCGWAETGRTKNGHPELEKRELQILDDKWLVVNKKLDTWDGNPPYTIWEPTIDPASELPIGVIELMTPILYAINDFLNIGMDNCRKIVESALLIDDRAWKMGQGVAPQLGPGAVNWCSDPMRSVAPLPMKDLPRSLYQLLGFLNEQVRNISGNTPYMSGMLTADADAANKTARGTQLLANLAADRFAPQLIKLVVEFYRPLAKAMHETARLRMRDIDSEMVRLPSPPNPAAPFAVIGPTELDADLNFSFNVKALDFANERRRGEFAHIVQLLGQMAPLFQQQGLVLDARELARIALGLMDREADAPRLVTTIAELQMRGQLPMAPPGGPFQVPGGPPSSIPGAPLPPAGAMPMPSGVGPMAP